MNWTIIKTEKEYKAALDRLEQVFDSNPESPAYKEAELLVVLIEKYETENEPSFPDPDPIEMIKFRMEQANLQDHDLAQILGEEQLVSEILNKKQKLTLPMIRKINKALHIPAEILISEYELAHIP